MNWQHSIRLSDPDTPTLLMALTQVPIMDADSRAARHAQLLHMATGMCEVTCVSLVRGSLMLPQWRAIYQNVKRLDLTPYSRFRALGRLRELTNTAISNQGTFDIALTDEPRLVATLRQAGCSHVVVDLARQRRTTAKVQHASDADVLLVDHADAFAQLPMALEDRIRVLPTNPSLQTVATLAWNDAIARPFDAESVVAPISLRKAA